MLPELRRRLPEARLPFERPSVLAATLASALTVQVVRRSPKLGDAARELLSGALSLAPAMLALRGGELAAYHGAEHVSIGTYEHGETRAKEHERCGSHLIGPLLAASAAGNLVASRAPAHLRGPARTASSVAAVGVAVEVFAWMTKHPRHPLAKALAKPGHELQHRIATAEPSPEQLEVAEAALAACLELEHGDRAEAEPGRLPPEIFDLPVGKMREGYYTDAYFNHTRETLLRDGRHPRVVMQVFQRNQAMLGGIDEAIAILKLCSDDWDALTVHALHDGDRVEPWETAMTIEGDYTLFAHLETVYLGVLTRRTLITTNTARVVEAANGKPIIFMPARHDHHRVQTGDGYAAYVAGAMVGAEIGVTSDAQASWWGGAASARCRTR